MLLLLVILSNIYKARDANYPNSIFLNALIGLYPYCENKSFLEIQLRQEMQHTRNVTEVMDTKKRKISLKQAILSRQEKFIFCFFCLHPSCLWYFNILKQLNKLMNEIACSTFSK
ncbi:hypothetical protein PIB30_101784 [Stylosanthes scabra]|uniref:Uncharacterized protein n=1 Tax=Stylosanthes scabra TaxID=79078 RepID=A0ABU6UWI2_9FABA|nr:hypothetical protein [Stylosanthes scabra]